MEHVNENERKYRFGDSGPKYMFRGPRIDWGILLLKQHQTMGEHYHEEVEETFYVVQGTPKVVIDGVEFPAEEGDAFRVEAKERHDIINESPSNCKIILIKCPYSPNDKVDCK
jgi:mannose-6-phosphate isomerase-like protein (cupin superfamily)